MTCVGPRQVCLTAAEGEGGLTAEATALRQRCRVGSLAARAAARSARGGARARWGEGALQETVQLKRWLLQQARQRVEGWCVSLASAECSSGCCCGACWSP